ncbi:MAG: N-acetyltransferase [Anaerolineales bacterium]|nr:MAG: N-acetyltransferase [Anaerolineales bacterium]
MNLIIRAETQEDYSTVEQIHRSAFRTDAESKVVNAIRANGNAVISLVAVKDDKVAGHILFSPVSTHPPTPEKGLGLAPVAVLPEFHSQGIGSALIRAGLEKCRKLGYDYAVVLGGPKYYMRFGFEKASSFGLQNEYGVDDEFMVIKFKTLPVGGLVKYTLEFGLFSV